MSGPAERDSPTSAYGGGISLNRGLIYGDNFTTDKFLGKGYNASLAVLPVSWGVFWPYDESLDYTGYEYGMGPGFSMGTVATDTTGIGNPIQLPKEVLQLCRVILGQCGAGLAPLLGN